MRVTTTMFVTGTNTHIDRNQKLTEQDIHSRWGEPHAGDDAAGDEVEMLKKQVVLEGGHHLGSFAVE